MPPIFLSSTSATKQASSERDNFKAGRKHPPNWRYDRELGRLLIARSGVDEMSNRRFLNRAAVKALLQSSIRLSYSLVLTEMFRP